VTGVALTIGIAKLLDDEAAIPLRFNVVPYFDAAGDDGESVCKFQSF